MKTMKTMKKYFLLFFGFYNLPRSVPFFKPMAYFFLATIFFGAVAAAAAAAGAEDAAAL
jgi:hypothetical protein